MRRAPFPLRVTAGGKALPSAVAETARQCGTETTHGLAAPGCRRRRQINLKFCGFLSTRVLTHSLLFGGKCDNAEKRRGGGSVRDAATSACCPSAARMGQFPCVAALLLRGLSHFVARVSAFRGKSVTLRRVSPRALRWASRKDRRANQEIRCV